MLNPDFVGISMTLPLKQACPDEIGVQDDFSALSFRT
jgi:hypothetical protein